MINYKEINYSVEGIKVYCFIVYTNQVMFEGMQKWILKEQYSEFNLITYVLDMPTWSWGSAYKTSSNK